jgi:hypothetical protein
LVITPGSNLEFNLIWDSSVGGAGNSETGFMAAVVDAAQFFEKNFTAGHVIVVNLHVSYGEVAGSSLPFGALAASSSEGDLPMNPVALGAFLTAAKSILLGLCATRLSYLRADFTTNGASQPASSTLWRSSP